MEDNNHPRLGDIRNNRLHLQREWNYPLLQFVWSNALLQIARLSRSPAPEEQRLDVVPGGMSGKAREDEKTLTTPTQVSPHAEVYLSFVIN